MDRAVKMTAEEFNEIKGNKETPQFIKLGERLIYNEYTCWNSERFGGTCSCINHPSKTWVELVAID